MYFVADFVWFWGKMSMCSTRKYPYSPQQKGLEFPGGWGICKAKKCKEMYEA